MNSAPLQTTSNAYGMQQRFSGVKTFQAPVMNYQGQVCNTWIILSSLTASQCSTMIHISEKWIVVTELPWHSSIPFSEESKFNLNKSQIYCWITKLQLVTAFYTYTCCFHAMSLDNSTRKDGHCHKWQSLCYLIEIVHILCLVYDMIWSYFSVISID